MYHIPRGTTSRANVRDAPAPSNLNGLLSDIYVRYIALREEDFQLYYKVFTEVFGELHRQMMAVDKYYERYSSELKHAGSHYDRLRITKPDEFDMVIVIGLPVTEHPRVSKESDIAIARILPGFMHIRAREQYVDMLNRTGDETDRTALTWLDDKGYILRSKFSDWFRSVGDRALNNFDRSPDGQPMFAVDQAAYTIRTSSSGPAWTIIIESKGFKLDVDLVPALKFPETRWKRSKKYRKIPQRCRKVYWLVVPKPPKTSPPHDKLRLWRVALQAQERQLLHDTHQLRQVVRLVKKLRDSQGMNHIASYYIKNLFLWEIHRNPNQSYWKHNDMETLFRHMLQKLSLALLIGRLPWFWNQHHDLFELVHVQTRLEYVNKIRALLDALDNDYKSVAQYLLTSEEYDEYKRFIKK